MRLGETRKVSVLSEYILFTTRNVRGITKAETPSVFKHKQ